MLATPLAALMAGSGLSLATPATANAPMSVQEAPAQQRMQVAPPAPAVTAPKQERAFLPLLPYMQHRVWHQPIWIGRLRDSGYRPRPI